MEGLFSPAWRALVLSASILVLLGTPGTQGTQRLAPTYQACPLTGKLPTPQTDQSTRCLDAAEYTCCDRCTDLKLGLRFVSANFSDMVRWAGIFPSDLTFMNNFIKGNDSSACTVFGSVGDDGSVAVNCENELEQLACAMACHPDSGRFMVRNSDGSYNLTLCLTYYMNFVNDCKMLPLPGHGGFLVQYVGYGPQWLNDLGNIAWGLAGLPEIHVMFGQLDGVTDYGPSCWPGPAPYVGETPPRMCCDTLDTSGVCAKPVLELFKERPYTARFANDNNASVSCRMGSVFKGSEIVAFSPPVAVPPAQGRAPKAPKPPRLARAPAPAPAPAPDPAQTTASDQPSPPVSGNIVLPTNQPPPPSGSRPGASVRFLTNALSILLAFVV